MAKLSDKRKNLLHTTLAMGFYDGKRNRKEGQGYRLSITGQKPLITGIRPYARYQSYGT